MRSRGSEKDDEPKSRDRVQRNHGEGTKYIRHSRAGLLGLEYSAFLVDGRSDLSLVIYAPATPKDADRVRSPVSSSRKRLQG